MSLESHTFRLLAGEGALVSDREGFVELCTHLQIFVHASDRGGVGVVLPHSLLNGRKVLARLLERARRGPRRFAPAWGQAIWESGIDCGEDLNSLLSPR